METGLEFACDDTAIWVEKTSRAQLVLRTALTIMSTKKQMPTNAAGGLAENTNAVKRKRGGQVTHGQSRVLSTNGKQVKTPTYSSWCKMLDRCTNEKHWAYGYYGGKGVKICTALKSFITFFTDMGERPNGKTIDRIDGSLHYSCGKCAQCASMNWSRNVRWADKFMQSNNTRRNRFLEFNGERLTLGEWSRKLGLNYELIHGRLHDGWSVERALTTAVIKSLSRPNPNSKRQRAIATGVNRKTL